MGLWDWIAMIGTGQDGNFIDNYGLGSRNSRVDGLNPFCSEQNLIISNTDFKLPTAIIHLDLSCDGPSREQ